VDKATKEILEAALYFSGIAWCMIKFYKTKNPRNLFLAMVCSLIIFPKWPFHLSGMVSIGIGCIGTGVFCCYENYFLNKQPSSLAPTTMVLFFGAGILFLLEALAKLYWPDLR
jgi:hypothetical protein